MRSSLVSSHRFGTLISTFLLFLDVKEPNQKQGCLVRSEGTGDVNDMRTEREIKRDKEKQTCPNGNESTAFWNSTHGNCVLR